MREPIRIGLDVAKSIFQLAIRDHRGKVKTVRLRRSELLEQLARQPEAIVFMEACGSSHFWGRRIESLGHQVALLPPHHVRPYVRGNKTDRTDARGILDAGTHADLLPVPVKRESQQQLTSIHRMRSGWIAERTRRLNSIRGPLREFGVFIPLGADTGRALLSDSCPPVRRRSTR